jgi:hypothetical protein
MEAAVKVERGWRGRGSDLDGSRGNLATKT